MTTHILNTTTVQVLGETLLESDGSFTPSDECQLPGYHVQRVEVSVSYTRGASGGLPRFRFQWKIAEQWRYDTTPTGAADLVGNTVETPVAISVVPGPAPNDSSPLGFVFTIDVRDGGRALIVEVAEADATKTTPGTVGSIHLAAGV